ncbi:hypothetical protein BJ878DRAFT_520338 [Calycina marina]|uniref:Uncharacterized protein n=1 Tax=Calycina marina TaxID=1763456 RepID=A0A9P8CCD1_9HELO|nr:hypothetical protein BJ878DRAFT_520338 [Calycina marina]
MARRHHIFSLIYLSNMPQVLTYQLQSLSSKNQNFLPTRSEKAPSLSLVSGSRRLISTQHFSGVCSDLRMHWHSTTSPLLEIQKVTSIRLLMDLLEISFQHRRWSGS